MKACTMQMLLRQMPQWQTHCNRGSHKVLTAIERCRSTALGYHLYACNHSGCEKRQMQYHSCRNRHCPSCGGGRRQMWVEARMRELIPCKYYHVVFTLPHLLNPIILGNRKVMFNMLFEAAHYTLQRFGKDKKFLGGTAGIISVLHTWGQNLSFHPHVHCIVSGGGIDAAGNWQEGKKTKYRALYPVQAMEMVYRGRFLHLLKKAVQNTEVKLPSGTELNAFVKQLYENRWVVYAKQPFGGPQQVIEYLGRYTHKVAISNERIRNIDAENNVTFDYKDYADSGRKKQMTISGAEFLRRFEQHILPPRYCKIRSYGLYSNHRRRERITKLLKQLQVPPHPESVQVPWHIRAISLFGVNPLVCPCCKKGMLVLLEVIRADTWKSQMQKPPKR